MALMKLVGYLLTVNFKLINILFALQLSDDSQLDFQITFLIIEIKTRIHQHFTNSTKAKAPEQILAMLCKRSVENKP
jgi:hypothetical protein